MKAPKRLWRTPILCLAACVLLTLASVCYAPACSGGRLVYPMESYSFRPTDMPTLRAFAADLLCALWLAVNSCRFGVLLQK